MKINSTVKENDKKKDISKYIMWAIVFAFVSALFLDILFKLIIMASKVVFKYWYAAIIIILVLIFFRKIKRKKNRKKTRSTKE